MHEDEEILVSVFYSTNPVLFEAAKSLLNEHKIKFWSNGEYNKFNLTGSPYFYEIKVYKRNGKSAGKILSELSEPSNQYVPSTKTQSFIVNRGIWIIILLVMIMIVIFLLFK